jgi:hypothetical protein
MDTRQVGGGDASVCCIYGVVLLCVAIRLSMYPTNTIKE